MKRMIVVVGIVSLLSGCAVVPPPVMSKSDAVARARVVYSPSLCSGPRYELPANTTGTGPHDFYNLFARLPMGADAIYGISIATVGKLSHADAEVGVQGGAKLKVEGRQQLSAGLGKKVEYVEATFSREFLERAALEGARLQVTSSRGAIDFTVPDWMFAALLEVADAHDYHRRFDRELREKRQARQQIRDLYEQIRHLYVKAHPELSERIKSAVLEGSIIIGMSSDDVRASWGDPDKVNRTVGTFGVHEQWIYGDTYLYFEDGVLKSWQDSR
ncbi:hypothetical protein G4L39_13635 [Limisphaera ngatamarikiensis]|uniref:Uncharacterized protein n=1 Tax=Limisphaera ngatamarikiensis TaxID=1324935 RepID=A0A6M1RYJ7_9BACT|nr:hypothetical protein [Limisphaera ngatamarikiensis]NGO40424.1 hypothetical protein [Limisphaera ngatamarikiensis]